MSEQNKTNNSANNQTNENPKTKPIPIENWENEGGNVIPTGSLPKITFPQTEEEKEAERQKQKHAA